MTEGIFHLILFYIVRNLLCFYKYIKYFFYNSNALQNIRCKCSLLQMDVFIHDTDCLILYCIICLFPCGWCYLSTTNRIFIKGRVKRRWWRFSKIEIDRSVKANTDLSALISLFCSALFSFSFYVHRDRLNIQFRRVKDSGRVRPSMSLASRYVPYKGTRKSVPRELQRRLVPSVIRATPVSR